ncbi:hypothetical protein Salat_1438700 [Sesamum alatum]|uniref:Uncharacterized protein n=1 Tax=Sesamum alatum TaxID=300844 RepID=A0AAE1YAJ8_9LAMI|nr:hypothetical protein Salat_1438700 [Sesamum alatum]
MRNAIIWLGDHASSHLQTILSLRRPELRLRSSNLPRCMAVPALSSKVIAKTLTKRLLLNEEDTLILAGSSTAFETHCGHLLVTKCILSLDLSIIMHMLWLDTLNLKQMVNSLPPILQ